MIYKFKSQVVPELIMLGRNGDQILTIIGKMPTARGTITLAEIPAAISALEAASTVHKLSPSSGGSHAAREKEANGERVMLRHRAAPFIDLLKCSAHAGHDVAWGV